MTDRASHSDITHELEGKVAQLAFLVRNLRGQSLEKPGGRTDSPDRIRDRIRKGVRLTNAILSLLESLERFL